LASVDVDFGYHAPTRRGRKAIPWVRISIRGPERANARGTRGGGLGPVDDVQAVEGRFG